MGRVKIVQSRAKPRQVNYAVVAQNILEVLKTSPEKSYTYNGFDLSRTRDEVMGRLARLLGKNYELLPVEFSSRGRTGHYGIEVFLTEKSSGKLRGSK